MKKSYFLFLLTGLSVSVYLVWRLFFTIPWHGTLFALVFGLLLWLSEFVSALTGMVLIWTKQKYREIEKPHANPEVFPHVDVLIATHNEPVDILYKTVNACVNMIYPDLSKVHIYLSDDTYRSEVQALAEDFGIGYIGLRNNKHAKSGNFNNALSQSRSPLVVTFDADMMPFSNFLMETVPYFIRESDQSFNETIGFVQTPQSFYNADVFHYNLFAETRVPNEQDFFSREVNVLNGAHNASVYTGSNTVISRQAIVDAGGFPTDTITEDFQLGATINSLGYTSIATLVPLASGLTPTDTKSVLKQRTRWARGVIQSIYNLRVLTNPKMTHSQKIIYMTNFMYWWSFGRRILYILAPILFTVFDIRVVETDFWILLLFWVPSYALQSIAMSQVSSAIRTQRWGEIYETILAPYLVIPVLLETLGIKQQKFKVTRKDKVQSNFDILFVMPHLILLVFALIGLVRFNYGKFGTELFYGSVINFWLVHHIINLFFAVFFSFGRPHLRQYERFDAQESLKVKAGSRAYQTTTLNISEGGLSFALDKPVYFGKNQSLEFLLQKEKQQVYLTGKIVRVHSEKEIWTYMVALDPMTDAQKRKYFPIIYDRHNASLPMERDVWMTSFDELWHVITSRYQRFVALPTEIYTRPQIRINREYMIYDTPVVMGVFDYEFMTISIPKTMREFPTISIPLPEITIHMVFDDLDRTQGFMTYRIVNREEVTGHHSIEQIILDWRVLK